MHNINFKIERAFQLRGLFTKSLSTLSHGIASCAKSYIKLRIKICSGRIGNMP